MFINNIDCPTIIYSGPLHILILLGIFAGILAIVLFFIRNKLPKALFIILEIILITTCLLYSYEFKTAYGGGCDGPPTETFKIQLLPVDFIPPFL